MVKLPSGIKYTESAKDISVDPKPYQAASVPLTTQSEEKIAPKEPEEKEEVGHLSEE